jgi:hypothetical protein
MKRPNLSDYIKTPIRTTTSVNNIDYEEYCWALKRYIVYLEAIKRKYEKKTEENEK